MQPLRILVAPSGFPGGPSSERTADCIEEGIRRVFPEESAFIRKLPLYELGRNVCEPLVAARNGYIRKIAVNGPLFNATTANLGFIDNGATAVFDVSSVVDPSLVPDTCLDPTETTSYGVGELIRAALDAGSTKIIVGCQASGALDGGAGMLQALGAGLLNENGEDLLTIGGGPELARLASINMNTVHPILRSHVPNVRIEAVCASAEKLCGCNGVALANGPQRKASMEQIEALSLGLETYAKAGQELSGKTINFHGGGGISGGIGAGLMLLETDMRTWRAIEDEYFPKYETLFAEPWDLVITATENLSFETLPGKKAIEIGLLARQHGRSVGVIAGTITNAQAASIYGEGVVQLTRTIDELKSLSGDDIEGFLRATSEQSMRIFQDALPRLQTQNNSHEAPNKGKGRLST